MSSPARQGHLAIGIALLCASPVVNAQQSVIDLCRQTSSDADRIACLEAAILGREQVREPEAPSRIDPPGQQPGARLEDTPTSAGENVAEAESGPSGIGAHQVIARQQDPDERADSLEEARGLRVEGYDTVPYEKLVVMLENGQVWRQINGDNQKIRVDLERNQTVDITESSLGGYKLRLNEMRRIIRVERIQ